jgi:hypothetical protein
MVVDDEQASESSRVDVPLDESVRFRGVRWYRGELPRMYVDGYTVVSEVQDLTKLREGDHVMVSFPHALLRGISPSVDACCAWFTSWDALAIPCFHHFIVLGDVEKLGEAGPLGADGKVVRVAEYSDTIRGAFRRVTAEGYHPRALAANAAKVLDNPYVPAPPRTRTCGQGVAPTTIDTLLR